MNLYTCIAWPCIICLGLVLGFQWFRGSYENCIPNPVTWINWSKLIKLIMHSWFRKCIAFISIRRFFDCSASGEPSGAVVCCLISQRMSVAIPPMMHRLPFSTHLTPLGLHKMDKVCGPCFKSTKMFQFKLYWYIYIHIYMYIYIYIYRTIPTSMYLFLFIWG